MIELAIDGSGAFIDLSVFENGDLIYTMFSKTLKTHSQFLVDTIDFILKATEIKLDAIDRLYCVAGPGRHTSIRVVISTLKGLFFRKKDIETFRVNSLDLLAASIVGHGKFRCQGEFFSKSAYFIDYEKRNGKIKRTSEIKKGSEEEIKKTTLDIFKTTEEKFRPRTVNIHKIKNYYEMVNLFDLNPIY